MEIVQNPPPLYSDSLDKNISSPCMSVYLCIYIKCNYVCIGDPSVSFQSPVRCCGAQWERKKRKKSKRQSAGQRGSELSVFLKEQKPRGNQNLSIYGLMRGSEEGIIHDSETRDGFVLKRILPLVFVFSLSLCLSGFSFSGRTLKRSWEISKGWYLCLSLRKVRKTSYCKFVVPNMHV